MKTVHRVAVSWIALAVVALGQGSSPLHATPPLRIDLGMATGRSDTAAPGWIEWQVPDGPEATRDFGGVRVTLRELEEDGVRRGLDELAPLRGTWDKKLLIDSRLGADGVIVDGKGLWVRIDGLSPGVHTVATYHNAVGGASRVKLQVKGAGDEDREWPIAHATPSHDVAEDADVAAAFVSVDTGDRWPLHVLITSEDGSPVILNGLEINGPDPNHKAKRPWPADRDEHADADSGKLLLEWTTADNVASCDVYVASDASAAEASAALQRAGRDSPEYRGTVDIAEESATPGRRSLEISVDSNASLLHYCWRVDSTGSDGQVTRGDTWAFRPRHLAFPGAEGYGRFAIGGRGGRVVKVTNLNDSGPGSFRAAVELNEPRTVIFDVGGRIDLKNKLVIRNPYLTIAGQTAPGKGVCISNYNLGMLGTRDVIIRYMRVRPGDTSGETLDGMGMASSDHAIFDHCSISWSHDEAFSSRGARNITLQRCLISEALNVAGHRKYEPGKQHGYAASISGDIGSFHHNLLAHCSGRNWSLAGGLDQASRHAGRLDIRNNVVYNWGHRTTDGGAK
ncbi:MAG TPA: hypothetical protein PJ982_15935, partial [Lacipirellulaceae bacterium]|nr:hypothetical protein [Lacipirellulaceae bacterium]